MSPRLPSRARGAACLHSWPHQPACFESLHWHRLRDYRYYADDMLHPSPAAADYITGRLLESAFDAADTPLRTDVAALRTAAAHRPAKLRSPSARRFARSQYERGLALQQAHPHVDVETEMAHFQAMLHDQGVEGADEGAEGQGPTC